MKPIILIQLLATILLSTSFNSFKKSEFDIAEIYQSTEVDRDTKALTDDGIKDVQVLLRQFKFDKGKYIVKISKKAKDLYKIDGKNIYIQTRYCYEYSNGEEVVLKIESSYGYSKGKVIF